MEGTPSYDGGVRVSGVNSKIQVFEGVKSDEGSAINDASEPVTANNNDPISRGGLDQGRRPEPIFGSNL